jgi:hypothetical protein
MASSGSLLAPVRPRGRFGRVDFDDPFALVGQEAGQPGAVATGALQRPAAPARRVVGDKAEQRRIASLVGWDLELGDQPAVAVKDRGGVAVAVGVDPDDVIDLAF